MASSVIWETDPSIFPKQRKAPVQEAVHWETPPGQEPAHSESVKEAAEQPACRQTGVLSEEDKRILSAMADGVFINGGVLFDCKLSGYDMVGFAVTSKTNFELKQSYYANLTWDDDTFLQFMSARVINDQQIFIFRKGKAESVYSAVRGEFFVDAMGVLRQLVKLLVKHQSRDSQKHYTPLCISPHTVFLVEHGGEPEVKILPLQIADQGRPCELPADGELSVSSDLYAACYLCSEIYSQAFVCEKGHVTELPGFDLIHEALSPFPFSRPELKAFANALELEYTPPMQEKAEPEMKVKRQKKAAEGSFFCKMKNAVSDILREAILEAPGESDSTWET